MVITTRGDERSLRSEALHQLKAQHATIEAERSFQVRDFEVDMANPDLRINHASGVIGRFLWCRHRRILLSVLPGGKRRFGQMGGMGGM